MGSNKNLQPVRQDEMYPLEMFIPMVGQGIASIREARRNGLRVRYIHGRAYIFGADWVQYVIEHGKDSK